MVSTLKSRIDGRVGIVAGRKFPTSLTNGVVGITGVGGKFL